MPYWRTPAPVAKVRLCSEATPVSASRRCSNTPAPQASICTSSPEPAWSGIGSIGASTEALAFAARRLEVEPIAVPFAARDEPGRVFEAPGVPDLVLSPLGPSESRAVVAAHFGDRVAPAVVDWLVA